MSPLAELRRFCPSWAADLRRRRDWSNLLDAEAAGDIAAEAAAQQARAGQHAYTAEQAGLEAARLFRAAQLPDSPGGRLITPTEAARAFRHLRHAHRHTHAVCQLLAQ